MLKKISLMGTAILVVTVLAVIPVSAAANLSTTTLGEGIYEKTGQVYEVKELGHAYHFNLRLDATTAYTDGSIRASVPYGVELEYNATPDTDTADWRTINSDGLILSGADIAAHSNTDIPMRITLNRAGMHEIKYAFYSESASSNTVRSYTMTWSIPISKYTITFADVPSDITEGVSFKFKAYIRNTESNSFNYNEDTLIRVTVAPTSNNFALAEKEEQKIIEAGQNTGSMDFVLPDANAVKNIDFTAMFESGGIYKLTFTLLERGTDGRTIATSTLNVQIGNPVAGENETNSNGPDDTSANPGTGSRRTGNIVVSALPVLTLLLFSVIYKLYRNEVAQNRT